MLLYIIYNLIKISHTLSLSTLFFLSTSSSQAVTFYIPWWLPGFIAVGDKITHASHPSLCKSKSKRKVKVKEKWKKSKSKGKVKVIFRRKKSNLSLLCSSCGLFCCFESSAWTAPEKGFIPPKKKWYQPILTITDDTENTNDTDNTDNTDHTDIFDSTDIQPINLMLAVSAPPEAALSFAVSLHLNKKRHCKHKLSHLQKKTINQPCQTS